MEKSYIAVDLETTGLDAKRDKIIEIGAIRILDGKESGRYHSMVNPRRRLEKRVTELTGITDAMVENALDIGDIIGDFTEFCRELPLLGHSVLFDYSFLKRAAVNQGISFEKSGIDTLKLCRLLMPAGEPKNLTAACAFFGISRKQAHRALDDAWDAHILYGCLAEYFLAGNPEKYCEKTRIFQEKQEIILMENTDWTAFMAKPLIYKVKKEQPATKKQKEDLRYFIKYHKIDLPVEIDHLSRNEISRLKDQLISQYGRIK